MTDVHQDAVQTQRLEAAVRRARRVEAHSLCRDASALERWANQPAQFHIDEGVLTGITRMFPPVEAVESLIGRCRPFLLQGDSIQYHSVLNAIMYFARHDQETRVRVTALRASWKRYERTDNDPLGAMMAPGDSTLAPDEMISTKRLSYAWLYADFIHANEEERAAVEQIHRDYRYFAGADLTMGVAFHVVCLLRLIERLRDKDLLHLEESIFTESPEPETTQHIQVLGGLLLAEDESPADALRRFNEENPDA